MSSLLLVDLPITRGGEMDDSFQDGKEVDDEDEEQEDDAVSLY